MSNWAGERDPDILRQGIQLLELENERLHKRLAELVAENAALNGSDKGQQLELELGRLQQLLDRVQRKLFGDSSERRPSDKPRDEEKKSQRGHGPARQPSLPIQEVVVTLGDDERECPSCHGSLEPVEGMTEDSERVTVVRRQFLVEKLKRQKYRCRCGGALVTAPAPLTHQPGGRYSLEMAAHIAVSKYVDHLPLDRQRRSMGRLGLNVTTQALWDQLDALAVHLEPAYKALRKFVVGGDVLGMDETRWRMMRKSGGKRWWVWCLSTPTAAWYGLAPSRSAKVARALLGDFCGTVVCDGYAVYETLAKEAAGLVLGQCWSHVRRKFVEAEPHYPQCGEAVRLIGALFAIDRETDDPSGLEGDEKLEAARVRLQARTERAPPILDKLREWALAQRGLPKSDLRRAIDYMLNRWDGLTVFVTDPYVPMDNNGSERALRGPVLGRKNHLGSRSARGAHVTALMYSLLETALRNGLEPHDYLVRAVRHALDNPAAPPLLPLA